MTPWWCDHPTTRVVVPCLLIMCLRHPASFAVTTNSVGPSCRAVAAVACCCRHAVLGSQGRIAVSTSGKQHVLPAALWFVGNTFGRSATLQMLTLVVSIRWHAFCDCCAQLSCMCVGSRQWWPQAVPGRMLKAITLECCCSQS
jgi:hypothetical protein